MNMPNREGYPGVSIPVYGMSYNPGDYMVGDYMWTTMKYSIYAQ